MKLKLTLILTLMLFAILSAKAQATIGTDESPVQGALLQLKTEKGITDDNSNADKGLLLPRVILTSLTASGSDIATTINGATGPWDKDKHIGLVVYHIGGNSIDPGVYVWNKDENDVYQWLAVKLTPPN
ncbi:hypothetical protein M2132_000094 [Dysgonomonas sp. PH5-45]|uniref:hypothetical protein n=1 Tax=unclassified Dysgonomonas TaxID=2630389 RepID=UPI0024739C05|nr:MULTISPECIES: hypothetical protein [unclassified Dysgonomonas]MDH6353777.1 hypothetical protein [Dysgonomonas sp. PH5-45]MDH6386680.1 hypothetical protein [Dysgonomonas sp. PH5-37]